VVVGSLLGAATPIPDRFVAGLASRDRVEVLFPRRSPDSPA
jgi:hypothetical protein